ncbi:aminotransferase class I/II-fold pyridoxal phosphate-dependent enzyme [Prochlorococcus marinus]|uniref:aminotransferase class I/II-fold pyridoxal phosphate-dependent enzyme n=1 Tax=Prochlorococcus marinus TaxID=1219 RepID=UPI0022B5CFC9|nr:aminotransferase class I/II-fold pyridoxal phosphate-dependent enzyme [Prochlorococcus marinus]
MKALILAAGYGNRMKPLTNNEHKTLLKINNERIIDRIIYSLESNSIRDIVIVTGYRHNELSSYLKEKHINININFIYNDRFDQTNNIYSLALAFKKMSLDDDILLIESDLIYDSGIIKTILESNYSNVALVSPYRIGLDGTVVELKDKKIVSIYPPHLQGSNFNLYDKYKTLNIYRFSREFCQTEFKRILLYYAAVIDSNIYYELILGILIYLQRQDIHCEIVPNNSWAEVDDPNDLTNAEYLFNDNKKQDILDKSFGGYWNFDILDFCFIRNMYFPPKSILSEIKGCLPILLENYGSSSEVLNRKLSYVLQVDETNLLLLNGAAQIYPILANYLANKSALIPSPTFGEYPKIFPNASIYLDNFSYSEDDFISKLEGNQVVVIVNPNNPTGTTIRTESILNIITNNPHILFILDESFIEFSEEKSLIYFLEDQPLDNIIVIKSMSKTYGLPGIRLGYIYLNNTNLMDIFKEQLPIWNNNSISEFYLEVILKHKNSLEESFNLTKRDRSEMKQMLSSVDCIDKIMDSGANFLTVRLNAIYSNIVQYMIVNYNIYIKDITNKFKSSEFQYIRLAVRKPLENKLLVQSLRNFFYLFNQSN